MANKKVETQETPIYKPMSVEEPNLREEIIALKLRVAQLERNCRASHGYR